MNTLLYALAGLVLFGAATIAQDVTDSDAGPIVRRTTLLVIDVERSKAFYAAIGFHVWLDWRGDQDPNQPIALPLTAKPTNSRVVVMAGRDNYSGMVGLLEFRDPGLEPNRKIAERLGIHDSILMIESRNIKDIAARTIGLGGGVLRPPADYTSNGPAGRKFGANMLLTDPDGYVVEVTEVFRLEPPQKQPMPFSFDGLGSAN